MVAGTHGKTTTTSMLSWIFHAAGLQPSFLIGGIAENFGSSFQLGQGKHFILEGDEYDTAFFDKGPKFLHYFPDAVILTSVEFDHADIYQGSGCGEDRFQAPGESGAGAGASWPSISGESVDALPGSRVLPGRAIRFEPAGQLANCGFAPGTGAHHLDGAARGQSRGRTLSSPLAGEYNVWNATAAAALAAGCGIGTEEIAAALQDLQECEAPAGGSGDHKRRHHH